MSFRALLALAAAVSLSVPAQGQARRDTSTPPVVHKPGDSPLFRAQTGAPRPGSPVDTVPPRQRAVVLSDAYATRLTVHRYTAYAILPLFAYQWYMGDRLFDQQMGRREPADWVRPAHKAGAYAIGTAFAVNTVTGAMNLWETRRQPEGRVTRFLHAASMTAALGGFAYTGIKLSQDAQQSLDKREQHRDVALASMGLTLASGTLMWFANR